MAQNWEKVNSSTLQVLEYLNKKGYSKSEAMLRMESNTEGGPLQTAADEPIGIKYMRVFGKSHKLDLGLDRTLMLCIRPDLMVNYVEGALDIYKVGLSYHPRCGF